MPHTASGDHPPPDSSSTPPILRVHVTISGKDDPTIETQSKDLVAQIRPQWKLEDMRIKHFSDGITNKLLGVHVGALSHMVLVRIFGEFTELLVDRDAERRNMTSLHAAHCCPPLLAHFDNGIAYGFAVGECTTAESVRGDRVRRLIASQMCKMHAVTIDGEVKEPCLFKTLYRYLDLAPDHLPDPVKDEKLQRETPSKEELGKEIALLERELTSLNSPIVLCHNDLLLNNIVYNKEDDTVTFIDYEYGAYNYQAYDIGNHFAEYAGVDNLDFSRYPSRHYQLDWLRYYLDQWRQLTGPAAGEPVTDNQVERLYVQVNKFALAAHLYWGIWALIQQKYSLIDFDFLGYGILKLNEYKARKAEFLTLEMPAAAHSTRL